MNACDQPGRGLLRPDPIAESCTVGAEGAVEILFANPPAPDDDTWVRCQYRAGQRAPDGAVWPQTALAQLAALFPDRQVAIVDANARRLSAAGFARELSRRQPRWYVTQVAGPTLENDLAGVALAGQAGAATVAFGPLVTPVARELLHRYPALDYILCGEPEVTLRELIDTAAGLRAEERPPQIALLCAEAGDAAWPRTLGAVRGLAWRHDGQVIVNPPRPPMARLDDLPLPAHHLLPLPAYRAPAIEAPAAMVATGRGCPAGCSFCLKHVLHGRAVRLRSPERILEELALVRRLGARHVYMQADLFAVCREQVVGLCRLLAAEGLGLTWSCSLRTDAVDEELLSLMAGAGCRQITWAIESGNDVLLWRIGKATRVEQAERALAWARGVGIGNWASFILGLPGETEATIQQTIALAKKLDPDRALFDLAVPRPGTPFWEEVTGERWLRPGARWEEADVSGPAIVEYPWLSAARLEQWQERAYREWALRPGSLWGQLPRLAPSRAASAYLGAGAQLP